MNRLEQLVHEGLMLDEGEEDEDERDEGSIYSEEVDSAELKD